MGFINLTWDSQSKVNLLANLMQIGLNTREGAKRGLIETAKSIMTESVMQCPIDTGAMVTSEYIQEPIEGLGEVSITFGYGGPNDKLNTKTGKMVNEYVLEVHENLQQNHPKGGKAKFLEDPISAYQLSFLDTVAEAIRIELPKGIR
jgi:hypothetical protein